MHLTMKELSYAALLLSTTSYLCRIRLVVINVRAGIQNVRQFVSQPTFLPCQCLKSNHVHVC